MINVSMKFHDPRHKKFHENWAKNATSVFTCFHYIHIEKNAPPTGGHVFTNLDHFRTLFTRKTSLPTGGHTIILTNFELGRDFIGTKLLTKFHEDGTRNVASRVSTSKCLRMDGQRSVTKAHLSNQYD
ncbi:hypothetical protein DPMN_023042 [Dreissena polymorpha]|uniref:Uncharacterized protein n=1 Tax=Dreissena polymorpha TaxID=45954 RepID=A0A9D4LLI6_DREPO|nr:hypothetical protein DPMN_023042 [Dreissena polymorpha]